tara:strand:- start:129 stop:383 length:255 start_codon:yes stop_codon:yes gene_type:complete
MTGEQVREYIENELGCEPVHDVDALASAIEEMSQQLVHDEYELMWLLLENRPIDALQTHSYGFHTANGRYIIETINEKYLEYEE